MSVAGIAQIQARIGQIEAQFATGASFAATLASAETTTRATTSATTPAPTTTAPGWVAGTTTTAPGRAPAGSTAAAPGWGRALPAAAQRWVPHIEQVAHRHGVDPRLLAALVKQESGFRADARSHAGAMGLAQLMPGTARELGVDPTDPVANLDGGARYLRQQLDRFGSVRLALAAYNAGPGRVAAAGGVPAISETRTYVRNVTACYTDLGGRP